MAVRRLRLTDHECDTVHSLLTQEADGIEGEKQFSGGWVRERVKALRALAEKFLYERSTE